MTFRQGGDHFVPQLLWHKASIIAVSADKPLKFSRLLQKARLYFPWSQGIKMLEHVDSLIKKNHYNIFPATIQLILGWKEIRSNCILYSFNQIIQQNNWTKKRLNWMQNSLR